MKNEKYFFKGLITDHLFHPSCMSKRIAVLHDYNRFTTVLRLSSWFIIPLDNISEMTRVDQDVMAFARSTTLIGFFCSCVQQNVYSTSSFILFHWGWFKIAALEIWHTCTEIYTVSNNQTSFFLLLSRKSKHQQIRKEKEMFLYGLNIFNIN